MSFLSVRRSSRTRGGSVIAELLENRWLLAIVRPDHIVIVMEQDRASNALASAVMPYFQQIASTGLVYSNSHGVTHPTQPNLLALYSGSTQGVTSNAQGFSFPTQANLAKSLFDAGFSFAGYSENLPSDGSQVSWSGDATYPDLYVRYFNPMAQFGNVGIDPATGQPRANAVVNRTFNAFSSIPASDYHTLPTVSLIFPNMLHSAHGSNEAEPWAGSPDEENNDILRASADAWLRDNLNDYLEWAKLNNSLLIVTQDEERYTGGTADTVTTFINGDPDLFVAGTNATYVNHYSLLRTILDMYGIAPLGNSATASPFATDATGRLAAVAATGIATSTSLVSSANPSTYTESVTFTATVSAAQGIPNGLVTFKDGDTVLGTGALNAFGVATLTVASLSAGSHSITAEYAGSSTHSDSRSTVLSQSINRAGTTTGLSRSASWTVTGQNVTFTATVASLVGGFPGGTVTFFDGATPVATVPLSAAGQASFNIASLGVGSHTITAGYNGNINFNVSLSSGLAHSVNAAATTTGLTSSANPTTIGQPITFTATVMAAAPGTGMPGGTVQFLLNGNAFGSPVVLVNGTAVSSTYTPTSSGSVLVSAVYSGNGSYNASVSATFTQTVALLNNSFASRIAVSGLAVQTGGTNVGATKELGEPNHAGNVGGKSVWWTWTAPSTGVVTIDTASSTFDTLLAVYTGTSVSKLSAVSGGSNNNDPLGGLTSRVTFNAVAGRVYQIAVDGNNGASGNIALRINLVPPAPGAPGGVSASDNLPDKIRITWNSVSAATSYEVWRGTTNSTATATKLTDVTGATAYDDTSAIAGVTYWYWLKSRNAGGVSGFSGSNSGYQINAALANNSFAGRAVIAGTSATILATNIGASKEASEPSHAGNAGGKSVWWTWTASASGNVVVDTIGSGFNTTLAVYTGSTVSALTLVKSDNDSGGSGTSRLTFAAVAGVSYQIAVDGSAGASGNIVMHFNVPSAPTGVSATDGTLSDRVRITWAAAPWASAYEVWRSTSSTSGTATKIADVATASYDDTSAAAGTTYYYWVKSRNDAGTSTFSASNTGFRSTTTTPAPTNNNNFADRTTITGSSATMTSSNVGATKETGELNHGGNVGGKSVWWTWTAPTSGTVTIDTAGSSFDTLLSVYTGSSLGSLTTVASNDDDFNAGLITSKVTFAVTAGMTYQIAVDGYGGAAGNIVLHLVLA